MKYRILLDVAVYILAPIILCNFIATEYIMYSIVGLIALLGIYSVTTRKKESRVNISGLVFASLCIALFLLKIELKSEYQVYIYDTYFLMLCGLVILLLNPLGKNVFTRIYVDILRVKGYNNLSIWSGIKKSKLATPLSKLSIVVGTHLIVVSLLKVYSILIYGQANYKTTSDLEVLISIIFLVCEIYMISKIISKSKMQINNSKSKKKSKYNLNNSRVINLNQYKNANK